MTLKETEILGKKLVKYGFHRSRANHHVYTFISENANISIEFKMYLKYIWIADFTHDLEYHTRVNFIEHTEVFNPEWLIEEHNKLKALFKFARV